MRARIVKRIAVVLLLVIVLLLVAIVVAVRLYLTPERLGSLVQSVAGKYLVSEVRVGRIAPHLLSGIEVENIEVTQPEGFPGDNLAQVDRVVVRLSLLPLLQRRIEIRQVSIDTPRIFIARSSAGNLNVLAAVRPQEPGAAPEEPAEAQPETAEAGALPFEINVRSFGVRSGELHYTDEQGGLNADIDGFDAQFGADLSAGGALALRGDASWEGLSAERNGDRLAEGLAVSSSIDVAMDRAANTATLDEITLTVLDTTVEASGTVRELGPEAQLGLNIRSSIDFDKLMGSVARTIPMVTLPVQASGRADVDVEINGTVPNPEISLDVTIPSLELQQAQGAEKPAAPASSPPKEKAAQQQIGPFNLEFLTLALRAQAETLAYEQYKLGPAKLVAALENNRFTLSEAAVGVAGGDVQAETAVDLGVAGLAYTAAVSVAGVDLDKALEYGSPRLRDLFSGQVSGGAELTGRGTLLSSPATQMSGKLGWEFQDGRITWPEFFEPLTPLLGLEKTASMGILRLDSSFSAGNGTIRIEPLAVSGPDISLEAEGTVTTDLALNVEAKATLSRELTARISAKKDFQKYATRDGQLVAPVTVRGTLSKPRVLPSVKGITEHAVEKAREEIGDKLQEGLKELDKKAPGVGELIGGVLNR